MAVEERSGVLGQRRRCIGSGCNHADIRSVCKAGVRDGSLPAPLALVVFSTVRQTPKDIHGEEVCLVVL